MDQIPIRTLNQQTAEVLARVERGEIVEVTNRGRPIARIVPIAPDAMSDLVVAGIAVPPTVSGPIPMPAAQASPGSEAGALLAELREEERW